MSTMMMTSSASQATSSSSSFSQMLMRPIQFYAVIADRIRQRKMLAELSDEMLKDIGLSRMDVRGECRKNFWQA
ncbi:MAG TPA: DUF1127 domain-containing protein [Geminicoccus sp.]|uniref:DUF1127 domain-containing protein n=1 Tax=Geminicoccus sp. TaxID=2024832 RepID=UPI002E34E835|nr:DUF1127 domain-containing protein [Geminicoccus sp.]HEX2528005.1 DUF1127 domain-containing protein [Geminicoccus sp.]